jgi:hypothetical protein
MPVLMSENPRQINAALLEKLDRFIEENYIPPESIPVNTLFLSSHYMANSCPKRADKGKHHE